jgi:prepilin-type processing-associated H-X9-DG protein
VSYAFNYNTYVSGNNAYLNKYASIKDPLNTVALVDGFQIKTSGAFTPLYSVPPGGLYTLGTAGPYFATHTPTFQGRHPSGMGNVLWYDGHVTSEKPYIGTVAADYSTPSTMSACIQANVGYLTPLIPSSAPEPIVNQPGVDTYYWINKSAQY